MQKYSRQRWLKRRFGLKKIPKSTNSLCLYRIFIAALKAKKQSVVLGIIKSFPTFRTFYSEKCYCYGLSTDILQLYPQLLEQAFELGLPPDLNNRSGGFLISATERGNAKIMKLGIRFGAKLEATNSEGEVALGYACSWAGLEEVKVLVEAGANVNFIEAIQSPYPCTALDCVKNGSDVYNYLRSEGAKHYDELQSAKQLQSLEQGT